MAYEMSCHGIIIGQICRHHLLNCIPQSYPLLDSLVTSFHAKPLFHVSILSITVFTHSNYLTLNSFPSCTCHIDPFNCNSSQFFFHLFPSLSNKHLFLSNSWSNINIYFSLPYIVQTFNVFLIQTIVNFFLSKSFFNVIILCILLFSVMLRQILYVNVSL